jgi:fluoride exporter
VAHVFSWAHLALVVVGGAVGTALRAGIVVAVGDSSGPWLVPVINIAGAFALALVTGMLTRRAPTPRTRTAQLFVGTGVLGGFTTYSALAVEAADPILLGWALGGAVIGTAAAWAGLALTRRRPRSIP